MSPTSGSCSSDDSADSGRIYATRFRGRMKDIQKKYDDIFSSVVEKALADDCLRLSPPPTPAKSRRHRHNCGSSAESSRRVSECDSLDASDLSRDSYSNGSSPQRQHGDSETQVALDHSISSSISITTPSLLSGMSVWRYVCECGRGYLKHEQLHQHLAIEHSPSATSRCTKCFINTKALRRNHICKICLTYTLSMDEHLRSHYQDSSSENAFMECRRCYRSFPTLREVREHERRVHYSNTRRQSWGCHYCHMDFASRHMRDTHLVAHIDHAVSGVWDKISRMQEVNTDQMLVNQCPICMSVMGSRKSFRLHIIHKHLLQDSEEIIASLGLPTVSHVIAAMSCPSSASSGKAEVKGEQLELDYPSAHPLVVDSTHLTTQLPLSECDSGAEVAVKVEPVD